MNGRAGVAVVWLAAAAAVVAAGCATGSDPMGFEAERIAGRWTWIRSTGGIAGVTITPESEGISREVRFLPSGRAEAYRDGELVAETRWALALGGSNGSFPGREVIRYDGETLLGGWSEQAVALPHTDTLVLADGCCDGFVWTFARVAP